MRFAVAIVVIACLAVVPAPASAAQSCGSSAGYSICLAVPDGVLTGNALVTVTVNGPTTGIREMRFAWGTSSSTTTDLFSDFEAPYSFVWPTDQYLDATQFLNVRVKQSASTSGSPVSLQVTLDNGNDGSVPQNEADWETLFQPRTFTGDPVIAGAGDGGDGTTRSDIVKDSIQASDAAILLYLGDLYERGTAAEFENNFGRATFDPEGGSGWGSMAPWTRPTLGNHEGHHLDTWRNFWHQRPDWDTFVFGGVRFLNLNSECTLIGGCQAGSAQYQFVQQVLASNTQACLVAFWHKPVLSVNADITTMNPIWSLLASNGGDLVLNGHAHTMEAYAPMNPSLQTGEPDSHMVELVAGAGGHNLATATDTDPRAAWQANGVPGAVYVTAVGGGTGDATSLDWTFRDTFGQPVTSGRGTGQGSVACGVDATPPSVPGTPTGGSSAPGAIDLTWAASTDDVAGTIAYRVFRDGGSTPVAVVNSDSTTTVSYRDTGLASESVHTYEIQAFDGTNASAKSPPSDPIAVMAGPAAIFADAFDAGFEAWNSASNLTIDGATGGRAPPSARAAPSGRKAFAVRNLGGSFPAMCMGEAVNVTSMGSSSIALLKMRSTGDVGMGRITLTSARMLQVRADIPGTVRSSGVPLPSGWHTVRLCGTTGTSGSWTLFLDGGQILSWTGVNNGTTPFGRVHLGDNTDKTFVANFDDVVVDLP